jgi:hypothetical protein
MSYVASIHSTRAYRYLPAIPPYSSGVAAEAGYEIIGLRFEEPPPVAAGFTQLDAECAERGLARSALVGIELRSPAPLAFGAFDEFNTVYRALLAERGLLERGVNPIARTNVVPMRRAPKEPVLFSAFLIRKALGPGGTDFVVAGGGELDGPLQPESIIARGDTTAAGLRLKAVFVIEEMRKRLAGLGKTPECASLVDVYTAHDIPGISDLLLETLPTVSRYGFMRWATRPPLMELEFEMDLRRVSAWHVVRAR